MAKEENVSAATEVVQKKVEQVTPKPSKGAVILLSCIAGILLVGLLVLGYFYYSKVNQYKSLAAEREQLSSQLEAKNKELEESKGSIPDTKPLEDQLSDYKDKIAKAKLYNDFFKYLNSIIEIHNGFTGWTDAEYQTGRGLAQKTGNASFMAVIDNAWNNQQQPVTDRLISVWKAIATGIETSLK